MNKLAGLALTVGVAWAGQVQATEVQVASATQKRLGVATAPLAAARRQAAATGFARVLDALPLVTLDSDLATAATAAAASRAEAARTKVLAAADATVSLKVAQAAQALASADTVRLTLLRRRVGLEWGPAFANEARRARLISELVTGRAALVRIDAPAGTGDVQSAHMQLGGGETVNIAILGPARTADPRVQTGGLIGVVRGPVAARLGVGMSTPVALSGAAGGAGVIVPRSALIRTAGQTFAYVRKDATHFERRALVAPTPQPEGLFSAGGFSVGEPVVVSGASALLAAETAPKAED